MFCRYLVRRFEIAGGLGWAFKKREVARVATNPQDIVKKEDRPPEQRRANAGKAGKPGAAAKRKRKTVRACLDMLLEKDIADDAAREMLAGMGIADRDMQNPMLIAAGLFRKAAAGDLQAVKTLMDTTGETDRQQAGGNVVINIVDDLR